MPIGFYHSLSSQDTSSVEIEFVAGHVDEPSNNARESRSGLSDNDPGSAVPIRVELDQQ